MDIKNIDWKDIVKTVAPSLATAFGGPLAGVAAKELSQIVLGKEDATEEELKVAMTSANPDLLLKLKEADHKFAQRMKELEIDLERIAASDRDSARKRQVEAKDRAPGNLATAVFIGFFAVLAALIFVDVPPSAKDPLNLILGSLTTIAIMIATYYFGSSAGSTQKTAMIDAIIKSKGNKEEKP